MNKPKQQNISMHRRVINAIVDLDNVITEKKEKEKLLNIELSNIKKEFKKKKEQISINKANSISLKSNKIYNEIEAIKHKIDQIKKEISLNKKSLEDLTTNITKLKEKTKEIIKNKEKQNLFDLISLKKNKLILIKIKIENEIKKKLLEQNNLINTKNKFKNIYLELSQKLEELNEKHKLLQLQLNDARVENTRKSDELNVAHQDKSYQTEVQKNQIKNEFEKNWISALKILDGLCKKIRQKQPHLNELKFDNINTTSYFPDSLAFGRIRLQYENWQGFIPRLLSFPIKKTLWTSENEDNINQIHQLLLRLMHIMPVGKLEIIVADPKKIGKSITSFNSLLQIKKLFPEQRVLTRADDLENRLMQLTEYAEDLIQNKFTGNIKNWKDYNASNPNNKLPYKILLMFEVPNQLTNKSLVFLERLLEHGPECGILPILTLDDGKLEDKKFSDLISLINENSKKLNSLIPFLNNQINNLQVAEEKEFWPNQQNLDDFLELIRENYEENSKFSKNINELWNQSSQLQDNSVQNITAPIGWTESGEEIFFSIGGVNTEHHALLAGRSGSGKSNLLHVLIHGLCNNYIPEDLSIYLLDYKEGTEFNVYARSSFPHIKLVATESDPEYGVTVLEHLSQELKRRAKTFKENNVKDFIEYREKSLNNLPRIFLIIDEFQILFSEEYQVAGRAEKLLTDFLRQGRAFGIHILLATQTLKGLLSRSTGQLVSQIGCRIALKCNQEDSSMILGSNNWEAAELNSPPEGIINNSNGAKSANHKFLIPLADDKICSSHTKEIRKLADNRGYSAMPKVFNGASLPDIPSQDWFKSNNCSDGIALKIGKVLNFDEQSFEINFENKSSANLFISGYDDKIHNGILFSILNSLQFSSEIDEIIYFNNQINANSNISEFLSNIKNKKVSLHNNIEDLDLLSIFDELSEAKRVIIIDGLETTKNLHPSFSFQAKNDDSPSELFKKILEEGSQKGTFVISFVENWNVCNRTCKNILPFFNLRIGFCMNEDDAGSFLTGSIKKLKGLEKDNRAIFNNIMKNYPIWFRPYIVSEGQ